MKFLFLLFPLFGCAATLQKAEPVDATVKTIGNFTGTALDDAAYTSQFQAGADKACGGKPYKVLERSRHPSTLEGATLPSSMFYWVIKCGS